MFGYLTGNWIQFTFVYARFCSHTLEKGHFKYNRASAAVGWKQSRLYYCDGVFRGLTCSAPLRHGGKPCSPLLTGRGLTWWGFARFGHVRASATLAAHALLTPECCWRLTGLLSEAEADHSAVRGKPERLTCGAQTPQLWVYLKVWLVWLISAERSHQSWRWTWQKMGGKSLAAAEEEENGRNDETMRRVWAKLSRLWSEPHILHDYCC